jgi:signal transduction histidine kinase
VLLELPVHLPDGVISITLPAVPNLLLPSIHRRLLLTIALTNIGAVLGIVVSMWLTEGMQQPVRWTLRAILFTLVLIVWTSVLRRHIATTVEVPLHDTVAAAEAIASGDTTNRVQPGDTREFDALSTSINRMTEQLLEADKLRMRVEKLATMGRLAAGISHEIGNPLAAIENYLHVARMRVPEKPEITGPLDAIEREVGRIDRIVRGLLDYARTRRLTPKAVVVDNVIRDVIRLLADQGVLRRVDVHTELEAGHAAVYAERHDLEQVFVNLLLNSVDATDTDGTIVISSRAVPADRIMLASPARRTDGITDEHWAHKPSHRALAWLARSDRPDGVLQVVIADSGTGVAPEDEERIFEPFFTTKVPGKGTGLGLAIVASTIENLGGTIWVQRAREGGAAFIALLPLHEPIRTGVLAITDRHAANPAAMNT